MALTVAATSFSVATLMIAPGVGAWKSLQRGIVERLYVMPASCDKNGLNPVMEAKPFAGPATVQEPMVSVESKANAPKLREGHISADGFRPESVQRCLQM